MKRLLLATTILLFSSNMMPAKAQTVPSDVSGLMGGVKEQPNPFPTMPSDQVPVSQSPLGTQAPVEDNNVTVPTSETHVTQQVKNIPIANIPVANIAEKKQLRFPGASEGSSMQPIERKSKIVDPSQMAFEQVLKTATPLSADQVMQIRKMDEEINRAENQSVGEPVKIYSRSVMMSLSPGEQPPNVRLASGMATALTFSDITGAEWPIMSVTVGDDTKYKAVQAGVTGKTNMVVITPLTVAGESNLVVTLVGHPVPIIMMLKTGRGATDGRVDVSIRGRGPNYKYDMSEGSSLQPTDDSTVQNFVDGLAPKGAHKLVTTDSDMEVWKYQGMIYVRTPLTVLSPAYISSRRNISGENIYKMVDTPVILAEQDGRMRSINITN